MEPDDEEEPSLLRYGLPVPTKEQREFFLHAWGRHYESLKEVLLRHGKEWDLFARDGDFFLVETVYDCRLQKIEVVKIDFITPKLVLDIQECLRDLSSNWGVMMSLSLDKPTVSSRGIVVSSNDVEQFWDWKALKVEFGDQFKWPEHWPEMES